MLQFDYLKKYNPIWNGYVFKHVVALVRNKDNTTVKIGIPGFCFSEFTSGPNLYHLAAFVSHDFPSAHSIGLVSATLVGRGIDIGFPNGVVNK